MNRKKPGQHKAESFLRKLVLSSIAEGVSRLPNLKRLAEDAGVSELTMLKAIHTLKAEGVLSVSHGKGINIIKEPGPAAVPDEETPQTPPILDKWLDIYEQFKKDLLNGIFEPGSVLPPLKLLAARYGSCYRTVVKAMRALVNVKCVLYENRKFVVPSFAGARSHGRIVLIINGDESNENIIYLTPRTQENLFLLERECARARVNLEIMPFDMFGPRRTDQFKRIQRTISRGALLGFVLMVMGEDEEMKRLLHQIVRSNVPVSFLDESGCASALMPPQHNNIMCQFTMGYRVADGAQVGNFLTGLGHRHIAFVSSFHKSTWSQNRLEGLEQALRMVGNPHAVSRVTYDNIKHPRDIAVKYEKQMAKLTDLFNPTQFDSGDMIASRVLDIFRTKYLDNLVADESLKVNLVPLFEQALALPEVTAWVVSNDLAAIEALKFLKSRGVSVPSRISLISFDNSQEASLNKLTSYDFNCVAVVQAMVSHILGGSYVSWNLSKGHSVDIDGTIVERSSTGPVEKKPA